MPKSLYPDPATIRAMDEKLLRVAAVILAAGRSTRMGEAKQLLPLGSSTVLETTVANVQQSNVAEVILVLGAAAERIQRLPSLAHLRMILNPNFEQGLASSLRAGISVLSEKITASLIVLGDQPFVQPGTIQQLTAAHSRTASSILIPTYLGKRGNPVLIPRALFPEVMQLHGDTGFRALFAGYPQLVHEIEVADEGILLDIDNQEDYRRLSASH